MEATRGRLTGLNADRMAIEWVWVLNCHECAWKVDFDSVAVPTRSLAQWAACCGRSMTLESVERHAADV